jgi:hypothetical protein
VCPNSLDCWSSSELEEPSVEPGIREFRICKEEKRKWTDSQSNQQIGFGSFGLGSVAGQQKELDQCHFTLPLSPTFGKQIGWEIINCSQF